MPARKPSSLSTRNDTKADRTARASAESSLTPRTALTRTLPAILRGRTVAMATWKHAIKLYGEIDGTIATAFDYDLLVMYCTLAEEMHELQGMRKTIKKEWEAKLKEASKMKPNAETFKDYLHLWDIANALFARFQGFDARLDGKRKLIHTLEQSLYLTPRSRAGVAPPEKEPEPPKSEMGDLLNADD